MCMPQLQEGDEIVHINGRIVKELPHHEVLSRFEFIFSFTAPSSKHEFSLPVPIHYLLLVQRIWLYIKSIIFCILVGGRVSNIYQIRETGFHRISKHREESCKNMTRSGEF